MLTRSGGKAVSLSDSVSAVFLPFACFSSCAFARAFSPPGSSPAHHQVSNSTIFLKAITALKENPAPASRLCCSPRSTLPNGTKNWRLSSLQPPSGLLLWRKFPFAVFDNVFKDTWRVLLATTETLISSGSHNRYNMSHDETERPFPADAVGPLSMARFSSTQRLQLAPIPDVSCETGALKSQQLGRTAS